MLKTKKNPIGEIIATLGAIIIIIVGYLLFRYWGLISVATGLILATIIVFYGVFFDAKVMRWLEQKCNPSDDIV